MSDCAQPELSGMDLYDNVRSYFIERVIQNAFPGGFSGQHPFRSIRALDVMSYTRIDSARYQFPAHYPFARLSTPPEVAEALGASDHELNLLENALPPGQKAGDCQAAILDIGCGYGGMARMLKMRYPHARVVAVEFQPLVRDLARKLTGATKELGEGAVEFWEPKRDPNCLADVHRFLVGTSDASFDAVVSRRPMRAHRQQVSFLAILHIPEKDALFREIYRVLKPGGRIIFEDLIGTAPADTLKQQPSRSVEAVRADMSRTDKQPALLESKFDKLCRVVSFNDALTLEDYRKKLCAAGFEPVDSSEMFVSDRSETFAAYHGGSSLRQLGVEADGSLGSALKRPGVYGIELRWDQWKAQTKLTPGVSPWTVPCLDGEPGAQGHSLLRGVAGNTYTFLEPSRCRHEFTEPAGSIVDSYLQSQKRFCKEVHELFNEECCCGGAWVFAQKGTSDNALDEHENKRIKTA